MRVLFWYCDDFNWNPAIKALEDATDATPMKNSGCVVAFIHVEPGDLDEKSGSETKLVKNSKWLARKWETRAIVLHSFTHLGEVKADPKGAKDLIDRADERLKKAEYETIQTPYGYFLDLELKAPGHPLARVYKEF